jgi:hypothetical protein
MSRVYQHGRFQSLPFSDARDSNIRVWSELPSAQFFASTVIDGGMQIDFNEEQPENASASI